MKEEFTCSLCGASLHGKEVFDLNVYDDTKEPELVCGQCNDNYWRDIAPLDNWWEWI
jgi:hypothetical protein